MNDEIRINYLVAVFGFLQLAMKDVGLIGEQGMPIKKKKPTSSELDGIAIYNWVGSQIKHIDSHILRKKGAITDGFVKKLFNDHKVVNNFLLGLLLLREYVDNNGTKMEQILMSGKIDRLIDVVDGAVSDEEFDVTIKKTTWRTADNLYRQFVGKAQLTDEIRDLKAKRFLR